MPHWEELKKYYELIPICPECDGGLPTPRLPSERKGKQVINIQGEDWTSFFLKGARHALQIAKENGIKKAILKAKSPSCGTNQIYDGSFTHSLTHGDGVTAELLRQNGIEVYDENTYLLLIKQS